MSKRIDARFAALKAQGRAAFVAYVMAGDPDLETSLRIVNGLPAAGADIIELGFPFSDPMADGPAIQAAALRALKGGMTLKGTLEIARRFREGDQDTPIVMMGYLNPLVSLGLDEFAAAAGAAGIDGLICVDCPPEEADPLSDALERFGIALIRLATPTTDEVRLPAVLRRTSGFVYYVSVAGVTGAKEADAGTVAPQVERIRKASNLPVVVGFGVKTPQSAASVARVADGVVVGSALVELVAESLTQKRDPASKVLETAARLSEAVRSVGRDGPA